jgi:glycerophosphoryl diester phosphodiesterase
MRTLVIAAGVILMGGCGGVKIVAHRGASYDAPENTVAAMKLAWEQGADAIECDVYLSADGQVPVIHDPTTRRTAGVDRKVVEQTMAELSALDVGRWKSEQWAGERLPTLQQVLATVPRGKRIYIEVKCGPEIVPELQRVLESAPLQRNQIVIISFKEEVIATVKRVMPWARAYWLFAFKQDEQTGQWNESHEGLMVRINATGADGADLQANEMVDERLSAMLRKAGLELHVWTVNDPAVARRMIEVGARSITTDRPAWLRQRLKENGP